MAISIGRCLKNKVVKEHINKNFATFKSLCNLQELYTSFKEKYPNVNIEFSEFSRPKWCVLAGSKMTHSVCVCRSSEYFVTSRWNGLGLDIQIPDQINFFLPEVSPPFTRVFFLIEHH